jgi:iron complex outermembrane receptor protein
MSFTPYPSSNNTLILYMRGQGVADAAQITLDSAVGLYQDGLRAQAVTFDLADIERSKCCAGRRARCTAATRRAARST